MKRKMIFLMLILFVLSTARVNAQVTIGSENEPHAGAVLDLQSTTQGFKLPSVALNEDLTQFVLPEDETSTKENAVGMLVFNTNPDIAAGVYVWTGTKWINAGTEHGTPGPNLVVGSNTYQTYIYPGTIGRWMISPSKEGTPDVKTYPGQTEGARGYYYRKANYASACPKGWHVPTRDEIYKFEDYMYSDATVFDYMRIWREANFAGYCLTSTCTSWDTHGLIATSDFPFYMTMTKNGYGKNNLNADYAISVFCIENP